MAPLLRVPGVSVLRRLFRSACVRGASAMSRAPSRHVDARRSFLPGLAGARPDVDHVIDDEKKPLPVSVCMPIVVPDRMEDPGI